MKKIITFALIIGLMSLVYAQEQLQKSHSTATESELISIVVSLNALNDEIYKKSIEEKGSLEKYYSGLVTKTGPFSSIYYGDNTTTVLANIMMSFSAFVLMKQFQFDGVQDPQSSMIIYSTLFYTASSAVFHGLRETFPSINTSILNAEERSIVDGFKVKAKLSSKTYAKNAAIIFELTNSEMISVEKMIYEYIMHNFYMSSTNTNFRIRDSINLVAFLKKNNFNPTRVKEVESFISKYEQYLKQIEQNKSDALYNQALLKKQLEYLLSTKNQLDSIHALIVSTQEKVTDPVEIKKLEELEKRILELIELQELELESKSRE